MLDYTNLFSPNGYKNHDKIIYTCILKINMVKEASLKSIIQKRKKKYDEIVLLGKNKLNTIEVLISKTLIDSYVSHDEFISVNNVLREYNERKEE